MTHCARVMQKNNEPSMRAFTDQGFMASPGHANIEIASGVAGEATAAGGDDATATAAAAGGGVTTRSLGRGRGEAYTMWVTHKIYGALENYTKDLRMLWKMC